MRKRLDARPGASAARAILGRGDQQRSRARTAIAYCWARAISAFTLGAALTLSTIVLTLQSPAAGAASPGWSVSAQDSSLAGISCTSPSDCMAVADSTEGPVALATTDAADMDQPHSAGGKRIAHSRLVRLAVRLYGGG